MALNFPASPALGQKFPASPVAGLPTYTWDGEKWTTISAPIEGGLTYVVKAGDTMTGDLTISGASLKLTTATDNYIRGQKGGIDRWVTQYGDTDFTLISYTDAGVLSGTPLVVNRATGLTTVSGDPTVALGVATKQYVDNISTGGVYVPVTGGTMSGHLTLPTGPADANAVRKDYVDTSIASIPAGVSQSYVDSGDNQRVYKGGDSMSGGLTLNAHCQHNSSTTINTNQYFGAGDGSKFQLYGEGGYPTIAFHAPGYFGANFGMNTNGNFYMGGWSFGGGAAYQFWTTRDFGGNPVNGVINMRQAYAADFVHTYNHGMEEPYGGGVITGFSMMALDAYEICRYRYMQFQTATGNWYTAPYA
jgi:hypothetical protein